MTGARELRSAIVLCRIRFEVPASELVKLHGHCRSLAEIASFFGGRSLGFYAPDEGAAVDESSLVVTGLLSFANTTAYEAFEQRRAAACPASWPEQTLVLKALKGLEAGAGVSPAIPFHLVKYH